MSRDITTCRRGGLELRSYAYLLVLWMTRSYWSEAIFARTYAYVRVSDTRQFRLVRGQSADKLLTSDTRTW
jgi:hypothetical protein